MNNNSQNFPAAIGELNVDFKKDGSFSIQGTPLSTWTRKRNTGNIYNIEAGTYTVYLKVVGNCPNARFTIVLEDTDMKTIASGVIGVSNSSLIKVATFNYDGATEIVYTSIVLESFRTDGSYDCTFYPMLMKDTYTADATYEQYGASPSLDYPSEIETVGNNVNLLNNTLQSQTINGLEVTVNSDKSVKVMGTTTEAAILIFDQSISILKKGTYTLKDCGTYIESEENHGSWNSEETRTFTKDATISASGFYKYYGPGQVVNVTLYPKLEKGIIATPYSPYNQGSVEIDVVNNDNTKSQTAIMPIQQELLNGDYIADVEHHEWGKIESYNGETITTDYISTTGELTTGATIYYKLVEPLDLELTEEQQVVRNTKLYTYKNITNISLSDELASIDVEYKKDQNAINKNYENRLAALETASTSEEANKCGNLY